VVVVGVGVPLVLGGYLIPVEGQDPALGASVAENLNNTAGSIEHITSYRWGQRCHQ
jgi:hypothetical protein